MQQQNSTELAPVISVDYVPEISPELGDGLAIRFGRESFLATTSEAIELLLALADALGATVNPDAAQ